MQLRRREFLTAIAAAAGSAHRLMTSTSVATLQRKPVMVGSRRQLLFDDFFFASQRNIRLTLHPPELKEVVLQCDRPWERKIMHYPCVLQDGGHYRMWYRTDEGDPLHDSPSDKTWSCYAESNDGLHWQKPNLGLISRAGSRDNNIFFPVGEMEMNAAVLVDSHARADERYKMIVKTAHHGEHQTVFAYVSEDGLRWRPVETNPFLGANQGPFDSHNTLLWDDERRRYAIYLRGTDRSIPGPFDGGRRAVRRSESEDFRHWSKPELVLAGDSRDPADFHIYTNAAVKYERAARAFLMFPMILHQQRRYPGQPNQGGLSEVIFATSRDGLHWERRFRQPFISPGLDERNWVDRNPIMGLGIVQTGPAEISMYYSEFFRSPQSHLRRATLRADGFVSVEGPYEGWGEFTTHPLLFEGSRLGLNFSTSGGGSIWVELQDESGHALPGFTMADCQEIFGDQIDGIVRWKRGEQVGALAGRPVRMRVRLRDAHLFAFRFGDS